jgi:glucokinase
VFRERFESKGRMSAYLRHIPTRLILRADPTFVGLRALALQDAGRGGSRSSAP